jgi:uncharacterized protein YceH (UPF0502 family)
MQVVGEFANLSDGGDGSGASVGGSWMAITLSPVQRRVLGVLIEKAMTTPAGYPLTLNSLLAGCNQLTCRDPVMRLTEAEVSRAVYDLQQMQLVAQAPPDRSARANRFEHRVEERFGWGSRERALMAELLLRGPQTIGELKQNASRMTPLEDLQYVAELVAGLSSREPPFVRELLRRPGKSVARFDHTFYGEDEPQERLARLEAEVASLRRDVDALLNPPG